MGFEQIEVKLLDWWPKIERDGYSGDRDVAEAAWASTYDVDKASRRPDEDVRRVVDQIVEQYHDTPKESVWLKYWLRVPIFVERQLDKYRMSVQDQDFNLEWERGEFGRHGISQNELSGRYRMFPERPYYLPKDVADILKEGADQNPEAPRFAAYVDAAQFIDSELRRQHEFYEAALKVMPAEWRQRSHPNNHKYRRVREVLRGILGTAYLTDMRITLNLNAFEHVVNQRLAPEAQLESRIVVFLMLKEAQAADVAPTAIRGMTKNNDWDRWSDQVWKEYQLCSASPSPKNSSTP